MVIQMAMKYLVLAITMIIAVNNCSSLAVDGRDTLLLGSSLTGNETIVSKNGTFALGFFSPRGTNNWYIGIWYARMSPKVVVWVANRDNPVKGMPGVLKFSRDGRLRLFDRKGWSVWSTDIGPKGSRAMITDPGNFIMLGHAHSKSKIVWESFAHPGDTWLPGMQMWKGMKLTSWRSSVDPASGLYSLGMDVSPGKTQLVMVYNNSVPYWSTGEWTKSSFAKLPDMDQTAFQMSCVRVSPSNIYFKFIVKPVDHTLTGRILFDENGEFKVYYLMDNNRWSLRCSTYGGQCSDYDICGAYGVCSANDVCSCIEGFTPKNDSQGWWSSGCARRRPLQCSVKEGITDGFLESKNQYLPKEEAVSYNNEPTLQGCRTVCLNNCSCTAFAFVISDVPVCRLWFGDLFKMRVSSDSQSVFIRLAASELPYSASERSTKAHELPILLPAAAAFSAVSALIFGAFILRKCRRRRKKRAEEDVPISLKAFTYKELRIATENFRYKLGSGAFGSVFRGTLPNRTLVAVKKLEGSAGTEKQFRAEITTIGRIQHVNVVRLWGFCVEGSRRLLVYAYMSNGSLNSFLFCKEKEAEKVLDWKTRFEIALGTARGLVYLHEECSDRIIHCDIKPENILLDGDFTPKVADFGLAKLVGRDFSRVLTSMRGTRGYLAPEWISGLPITPKADVYSFGMTLLEIISGRRNLELVEESRFYFPTWASCQIQRGNIIGIVDARIVIDADIKEVRRAAVVAGLCIQDDENRRPSMDQVVKILEGTLEAPVPQIPRSLQVLLDQVDDDRDIFAQHASISSGLAPEPMARRLFNARH